MQIKTMVQLTLLFVGLCLGLTSLLIVSKLRIVGFGSLEVLAVAIVQLTLGTSFVYIAIKWMLRKGK